MNKISFVNGVYQINVESLFSIPVATITTHAGWSETCRLDGLQAGIDFVGKCLRPARAVLLIEPKSISSECFNCVERLVLGFRQRKARLIVVMPLEFDPLMRTHFIASTETACTLADAVTALMEECNTVAV